MSCSLVGKSQTMRLTQGTIAFKVYKKELIVERFQCNYGLNEEYKNDLDDGRLKISGVDMEGNVRIIEILHHPFFIGTLYLPQISSKPESAHPLILSFVESAINHKSLIGQA